MTDIALFQIAPGDDYDLAFFNGDFVPDDSLRTAVFVSLFTDKEYPDAADGDRRGWWGDALAAVPGDRIGSLLWLLQRELITPETNARAEGYAKDALAWMLADGVASSVKCTATRVSGDGKPQPPYENIDLAIEIDGPTGALSLRFRNIFDNSLTDPLAGPTRIATGAAGVAALYQNIYFNTLPEAIGDGG